MIQNGVAKKSEPIVPRIDCTTAESFLKVRMNYSGNQTIQ